MIDIDKYGLFIKQLRELDPERISGVQDRVKAIRSDHGEANYEFEVRDKAELAERLSRLFSRCGLSMVLLARPGGGEYKLFEGHVTMPPEMFDNENLFPVSVLSDAGGVTIDYEAGDDGPAQVHLVSWGGVTDEVRHVLGDLDYEKW